MAELLPHWDTDDVDSLRRFALVQLIALDLDGTLVQALRSEVYRTILNLRAGLARQGVHVTLATGRALQGVAPILAVWGTKKDVPLVLYNGSVILVQRPFKILRHNRINMQSLHFILSVCAAWNVRVLSYSFATDSSLFASSDTANERVCGWGKGERTTFEINGLPIRWMPSWSIDDAPRPTAVLVDVSADAGAAAAVPEALKSCHNISVTRSGASYLEIRPANSNKATALATIADYLGVAHADSMALGDNDNDVEMLQWSGIGVTVSGASPAALAASDFVCRHGTAEGAVETLRLVKQARRFFPAKAK